MTSTTTPTTGHPAMEPSTPDAGGRVAWPQVWAMVERDLRAVRRAKAVFLPMMIVPTLLLVVLPLVVGLAARSASEGDTSTPLLQTLPDQLAAPIEALPVEQQLVTLVLGYLLAPLFLIVPLMVSAVIAADAFAGEKERRTLETLLHLPMSDRDLFVAKLLTAYLPALAVSWVGFAIYVVIANAVAWPVIGGLIVPNRLWLAMILWVAPAVAALGLGVMVRVSARTRTTQEANQLGGAVILPLIFLAVGQSTGLLLVSLTLAMAVGAVLWVVAIWLILRGAHRFSRDGMAAQ